jgi:hypothetical protein
MENPVSLTTATIPAFTRHSPTAQRKLTAPENAAILEKSAQR